MGSQGAGRKRLPTRERLTAEDDALSQIAREAEARLAAKRAARAEARDIRMKELERQQKEIYQVQKKQLRFRNPYTEQARHRERGEQKYYGLDTKWGDIERWMEDSERYARGPRRNTSASDEDERASVGSRGSLRTNGYDGELYGSQSLSRRSGRSSSYGGDGRASAVSSSREETLASDLFQASHLHSSARPDGSYRPSEPSGPRSPSSRAASRASSARASPAVEERDFAEKGSRGLPGLSAATLASLGGPPSRRGSAETSTSIDTEASVREIKELNDLKGQIQDVEGKYMQGLKAMKDSLAEVEEKYKRAMVSNAQLDNEKTNFMYQVDTLKEVLLELEEQLAESRRQCEEKSRELEREKHAHGLLRFQLAEASAALKQREEMLEEIRQLQQTQASHVREISDLQETIDWKDKKIGALERQKEFFDAIRSERDGLREEVVVLREESKKYGIILNSEVTANGEASDALNNVGCPGAATVTKEELNATKATADGTLGRAQEVEVKNEIAENVGKREILPHTEQDRHTEDPMKDCADTEVSPPEEHGEDQRTPEASAPSPGASAEATEEEQAQSQTVESTSPLERTEQVGSDEVAGTLDGRSGAPLAPPRGSGELDRGSPGPRPGEVSCDASDSENQREKPIEHQEQETQELKTGVGDVGTAPRQEPAPLPASEVETVTSADSGEPGGSPTPGAAGAGLPGSGEQVGAAAPSPPGHSEDAASQEEACVADVRVELDSRTGGGLERDPASQGAGETGRGPLVTKEPSEESNDPPGEALDASQKKTKNKKKKNKKKKSPAPVEAPQEVGREFTPQSPALSEGKEGGQVAPADKKSGAETQNEATGSPGRETVAGSREHVDRPENPEVELEGQLDGEDGGGRAEAGDAAGDGEPLPFPGAAVEASGPRAGGGELDEGVVEGDADDGTAPSSPAGDDEAAPGSLTGDDGAAPGSPTGDDGAAPGSPTVAECPTQTAGEGLDSVGLGDRDTESKDEARGRNEDKSKEDCTLS